MGITYGHIYLFGFRQQLEFDLVSDYVERFVLDETFGQIGGFFTVSGTSDVFTLVYHVVDLLFWDVGWGLLPGNFLADTSVWSHDSNLLQYTSREAFQFLVVGKVPVLGIIDHLRINTSFCDTSCSVFSQFGLLIVCERHGADKADG